MKFKVGDKVRINERYFEEDDEKEHVGTVATIVDTSAGRIYPIKVGLNWDGIDTEWLMLPYELEMMED